MTAPTISATPKITLDQGARPDMTMPTRKIKRVELFTRFVSRRLAACSFSRDYPTRSTEETVVKTFATHSNGAQIATESKRRRTC